MPRGRKTLLLAPISASDPQDGRIQLFEGLLAFLNGAAQRRSLLIVLDDLHAADYGSLQLLSALGQGIGKSRVLIIGAH